MSADQALYLALVVTLALWVTIHVVLAAALALSARKRLGALSFFVPVAAPIVAFRSRERALGVAWLVAGAAYVTLLLSARR
ncbi:MAG TPA: hypothetical protein VF316_21825 [Polyangiaceae bacterium]